MSLKVNFYCDEKYFDRVPEPVPASKVFPKWYSELPYQRSKFRYETSPNNPMDLIVKSDDTNLKRCLGVTEFLNTGYVIPSWADFIFRENEDGKLIINWHECFFDETSYSSHLGNQYENMPNPPIYGHFGKIFTPWIIKTAPGVSCLAIHPVWHRNTSFTTAFGVMHTDKTPMKVAWFFEWNYKIQNGLAVDHENIEKQLIKKGEPIMTIIPFYRKNFSHTINYLPTEKMHQLRSAQQHLTHTPMGGECPYRNFRKTFGKLFS